MIQFNDAMQWAGTTVSQMAASAGFSYLCVGLFTSMNPVTGAIFGATSALVSAIVNPIFEKFICSEEKSYPVLGFARHIFCFGIGVAVSTTVTTALGFPMTFSAGLVAIAATWVGIILVSLLVGAIILCAIGCGCLTYERNRHFDNI